MITKSNLDLRRALGAMTAGVLAGGVLALSPLVTSPVHAASIVVTTTDQGLGIPGCSLQEAILAANHDASSFLDPAFNLVMIDSGCAAGSGADIIELMPGVYRMGQVTDVLNTTDAANYTGPSVTPMITSPMIVEGRGAVLIRTSTAPMRAFVVGQLGNLDLREVHVKGFAVRGGNGARGGGGGMGAGGAIFVHGGSLLVQWSTFEGNTATGGNGSTGSQFDGAGGGGGGVGGNGGRGGDPGGGGGGGGGSRGNGGDAADHGAGGGGTVGDGGADGGFRCGGAGGDANSPIPFTGEDGHDGCAGGGGGGGAARDPSPAGGVLTQSGTGGTGGYGGGGGGGGWDTGDGGHGGFGGGGGAGAAFAEPFPGGGGGDGGFGGGGGSGPGGDVFGEPGDGGTFAGNATDFGGGGGAGLGGAIFGHQADITISNSTFTRNAAVRGVGGGEGAQNGADAGGAIFTVAGSLTVVNSTIAGNESTGDGAGITVYNPTTGEATSFVLRNTIVAANTGRDECFVLGGVSMSGWNNLVTPHPLDDTRTSCPGITQTGDPLLAPLTLAWPGRTPTMALNAASPAIDAGDPVLAPPDDQRGVARPQFAGFDIGAYEFGGPSDTIPPVADPTTAPAPNANGWTNSPVTVTWNWADEAGGSGIDPANCMTSSSTIGEGLGIVLTAGCADVAGNLGSASATVNVDLTAPTVTCSATPALVVGSSVGSVSATVTDALSGPVDGTVTSPIAAADLASPGVKSVDVSGADRAGNMTTVACTYVVQYDFGGFLEPIPQTNYRRGSTIPVRFQLGTASGALLSDQAAAALLAPVCRVQVTLDGVSKGCVRYDAAANKFQIDVKTTKSFIPGEHTIAVVITAGDGSVVNTEAMKVIVR